VSVRLEIYRGRYCACSDEIDSFSVRWPGGLIPGRASAGRGSRFQACSWHGPKTSRHSDSNISSAGSTIGPLRANWSSL